MLKEDTASPTVLLQSVFLTCGIEAHEGHEAAIIDIPNAFVQTNHKGQTMIMKIKGQLAHILVEVAPEIYEEYLTEEDGVPVLYVELLKALYRMMESSLLFYKKLVKDIQEQGFKVNPYDPCMVNKMVNRKQLILTWHVDDLKAFHVDKKVIDEFIQWIHDKYKDFMKAKPSRGKKCGYLAMLLDYSSPGVVKIDMSDYIKSMVSTFPYLNEIGMTKAKTPAAEYLFKTNADCKKIDK